MKSAFYKNQVLSSVPYDERVRIVRLHCEGKIDIGEYCEKFSVTRSTFMQHLNRWLIEEYKAQSKRKELTLVEIAIKDLSFTERLKYELSKINNQ